MGLRKSTLSRRVVGSLRRYGIDVTVIPRFLFAYVTWFRRDLTAFKKLSSTETPRISLPLRRLPILTDKKASAGSTQDHYFWQDLLVAREIFSENPRVHLDIGSRIDGFVAHVASFRNLKVLDVRPLESVIAGVDFITSDLDTWAAASPGQFDSISSLHALEHFGLGRYGDSIDPDGWFRGLKAIHALLEDEGFAYISVPVGTPTIYFNAHRVFDVWELSEVLETLFTIEVFWLIDDDFKISEFKNKDSLHQTVESPSSGLRYGCGIWKLRK